MVKRQHYIPQFYLKRLGKKDKIDVYDIKNKKYILHTDVKNFACKGYFYDIDASNLEKELSIYKKVYNLPSDTKYQEILNNPQFIEETFSRLESKMAEYLNKFENDFFLINDEGFLSIFFLFLRTLAIRTMGYREALEKITTQTTEWLNKLNIKECVNYPLDISPKELAKIEQLRLIVSLSQTYKDSIDFFNNYDIYIGVNNSNLGFFISNEPLLSFALGFNDICFPVNPKLAIIMRAKEADEKFLICNKKPDKNNIINLDVRDVVKYNIFQNHLKSKYFFGSKNDIEYTLKIISITEKIKNIL